MNKAPPAVSKAPRPSPGEEYETPRELPPVENVVGELPPASAEPLDVPEAPFAEPQNQPEPVAPPAQPPATENGV